MWEKKGDIIISLAEAVIRETETATIQMRALTGG